MLWNMQVAAWGEPVLQKKPEVGWSECSKREEGIKAKSEHYWKQI